MGNQLLKGYTLQGQPISNVGCEKMWRIYQGHKQNTNTQATIFAIEKRTLPKNQRDELLQFAKRQGMSLARIRHPGVLAISQALIQDQQIMAFSTQQIQGNLSMLAQNNRLKQIISNQIQLRLNLFPLLDTIQFLHQNVKTVHLALNFDNIYITKQGKWKISGFSNSHVYGGDGLQDIKSFRCSNYYFCPPQIVTQKKFDKKSDVYQFGILILDLMLVLIGKYEPKSYKSQAQYTQNFEADLLKKINCQSLQKTQNFKQLKALLKNILGRENQKRFSIQQLSSSKWLNDRLVLTVRYLENITNYDNKQQIQFLKGLMGILNHFQSKILLKKIVPLLLDLVKFKHLIPSVVYICLQMMKNQKIISETDFKQKVWPSLKKVVQGKEMTAHSLYLFVDNMQKLEKVIGIQQLTQFIIPLYIKCFDCPPKLKELALHKTDYILNKMDYQFVKTKMIPKVMNCIKDINPEIYKKSLIVIRKSIKILDTQTVTSIVLPGLQACKKSGSDPFVNAITVSIYGMLGKTLPTDILCSKLIPTILPFLSDPNVGPQDFYNYKDALLTMIQKIQTQRKKFWDDGQITQGKGFTQKDFQFEQQKKKGQASESGIGKGQFNFLSNYNNNKSAQAQQTNNESTLKKKQSTESPDFNFSSPFNTNFDNNRSSNSESYTPQPQNNFLSANPTINNYDNSNLSGSIDKAFANLTGFGQVSNKNPQVNTTNINSNTGMNMGSANWNQPKTQLYNQPFSPQSRPTIPKLKGPDNSNQLKIKKPEPYQQPKYEMHSDPWATINMTETTSVGLFDNNSNDEWNYPTNSSNTHTNAGMDMGLGMNFSTNKSNPSSYGAGSTMTGMYMGGNNFGDDPFAQIQKGKNTNKNTQSGMNMGLGNMNMNSNLGFSNSNMTQNQMSFNNLGGTNMSMDNNYNYSSQTSYNIGGNSFGGGLNTNMNMNMGMNNLDGFGYSNSSFNNNNNNLSFGMGTNTNQNVGSNSNKQAKDSGFDLLL